MRLNLLDYQEEAVIDLLRDLEDARRDAGRGRSSAITFSAPTGAGKTVMAAALVENVLVGGSAAAKGAVAPAPGTSFLWLSDNPQLNEQSRRRMASACDLLGPGRFREIDSAFDEAAFDPGIVFFLNTQKLRGGALLTTPGDRRAHTIWETIARTQEERPGGLVLIVDEAHRGLDKTARERNESTTILSAFLSGSADVRVRLSRGETTGPFPPIATIVGISATPDRFDAYLAGGARVRRTVQVQPGRVRASGLIKQRLVLHGHDVEEQPWTLLEASLRKVRAMDDEWSRYAVDNGIEAARPLLMVQVEDGGAARLSATPLEDVLATVDALWPHDDAHAVVHCFGTGVDLTLPSGRAIPHVDPAAVSADTRIRVVLFKTALNTGWDCPRAEVLMSFRRAADATSIAQLVGRMVRTPLGHEIPGRDELNAAFLYLPHFNRDALLAIKRHLEEDADVTAAEVELGDETVDVRLRTTLADGTDAARGLAVLQGLPIDVVPAERPVPDLMRLFRLARLADMDGVGSQGGEVARASRRLRAEMRKFAASADYLEDVEELAGRRRRTLVASVTLRDGEVESRDRELVDVADLDVDHAFERAAFLLAPDLAGDFYRAEFDEDDPGMTKLRFVELAARPELREALQTLAAEMFDELFERAAPAFLAFGEERRAPYLALRRTARRVQRSFLLVPDGMSLRLCEDANDEPGHLFVPAPDAECPLDLNGWERTTLNAERARRDFLAFVRNEPRKPWSLSYAYDDGTGWKPGFPDLLVLRNGAIGEIVVDVIEPHRGEDSLAKARGMAAWAASAPTSIGRVEMTRVEADGTIRRLNLHDQAVRAELKKRLEQPQFLALFK